MARIAKSDRENTLQQTRQRLLESAAVEFSAHGYTEANINTISLAAGFSKGTIYNYFPSKQALMLALIAGVGKLHVEMISAAVRAEEEVTARLRCFYKTGFQFVEAYPVQARFLLTALNSPDMTHQQAMGEIYQPMMDLVEQDILAFGMAQGIFRPMDLKTTTNLIMTLYLGTASRVDSQGKPLMNSAVVADFALQALLAEKRGEA
ncbi:MAG TPA: TetR/AcrR family transcriptional regulator [Anaerolineaceae bacterium]|nr:TetR/AcrR family transcriptional regulator [Anaerolineaceae bacterium]HPN49961.1 TetR/AcrR family transcriptional regulator [Anaerolineaceae bacterium]